MCRYEPIKNYSVVGRFVGGKIVDPPTPYVQGLSSVINVALLGQRKAYIPLFVGRTAGIKSSPPAPLRIKLIYCLALLDYGEIQQHRAPTKAPSQWTHTRQTLPIDDPNG